MTGRRMAAMLGVAASAAVLAAGCGATDDGSGGARIVVTTPTLGALVGEMAGDDARVEVLMPNGADPHEYRPSARQVAALSDADLVVENGLGLEAGLVDAIDRAREDGVEVLTATDHVVLLRHSSDAEEAAGSPAEDDHAHGEAEDDHAHSEAEDDHAHEHPADDPHIWMDPIAMRDVVLALAPHLEELTGADVGARSAGLAERLEALDREVAVQLAGIPGGARTLVTGHESMGYFAQRYDLELIGSLVPSLSSQAQVSAANLAELRNRIEAEGVDAIFAETGTPESVARAIADETGARVVEIGTHTLPDDGSYFTFIRDIATEVDEALDPA
ncbi:MAG: metal ABC transporter substrate-binding protein [Miltoncostaeaceae bacterium]